MPVESVVQRIVQGGAQHRTRFHDEKGNIAPASAWLHAPHALGTAVLRRLTGYRPVRPTLSYAGARAIAAHLRPDAHCLEFGSGMSTPWLARRCATLLSIESDPGWYEKVGRLLRRSGITNVDHQLRELAAYETLADVPGGGFDFVLVDGDKRDACVAAALPHVKKGGAVYLDNCDKDTGDVTGDPDGEMRRAERLLLDAVRERGGTCRYFTDFSPTNFFVEQGMLATL